VDMDDMADTVDSEEEDGDISKSLRSSSLCWNSL
jgi:hypothetical protein